MWRVKLELRGFFFFSPVSEVNLELELTDSAASEDLSQQ